MHDTTRPSSPFEKIPSRVVIVNDFSVVAGGTTTLALLAAKTLAQRGIKVSYICGDHGKNFPLTQDNIEVIPFNGTHIVKGSKLRRVADGLYNFGARQFLQNWINNYDSPDTVYHLHGWSKIYSPSIFQALRSVKNRAVVHAHDFFLVCPNGGFYNHLEQTTCHRKPLSFSCIKTQCDRNSYPQKLWRVTRSSALQSTLGETLPFSKILLVHGGMKTFFDLSPKLANYTRTVKNPAVPYTTTRVPAEENQTFLYVGRIEAEKGIQDLCAAATIAKIRLEVIGDGNLLESLKKAYPYVVFHGWKNRESIKTLATNARALVMPSRYPEPFGLVAVEAAWSGIPVISGDAALLTNEITRNNLGFSYSCSDISSLVGTLKHVANLDAESIKRMSERGFKQNIFLANSAEAWVDELTQVYSELLDKPTNRDSKSPLN